MTTRFNTKVSYALSLAIVLALLLAPLALADAIQNDVTGEGDERTINATSDDSSYTAVKYWIVSQNGDDENGCNATTASPATVVINTNIGVTADPDTLTFTACGNQTRNYQSVNFSATTAGDYSITVEVYDNGVGDYRTDQATFTLHVLDPTPPAISYVLEPVEPDGANGWYKSDVSLTWQVSEPESPNSLITTGCEDQSITADQLITEYSCAATSAGGSAGPVSVSIQRDATPPEVSLVGGPEIGASYLFGDTPPEPKCTASDATSELDGGCSVQGYSTLVGDHIVTASAIDMAGNSESDSLTYTVLPWTLLGFYQPVDIGGVFNVVKGGSTVPLKFEVFKGETELTDISIISSFVQQIACDTTSTSDDIEDYATGGTSLRYDDDEGQFIFNWQTPKSPGTCYTVTMTTQDGSFLSANFRLK